MARIHFDRSGRFVSVALLLCCACAPHALPPAETPEPFAVSVDAAPPAEGYGRLVIDVVGAPSPVERVTVESSPVEREGRHAYVFTESSELVCAATPCVLDVRPGNVLLRFPVRGDMGGAEVDLVHVGPGTSVYRRALSEAHYNGGWFGLFGGLLGVSGAIGGGAMLDNGLGNDPDLAIAGGVMLGASALLLAVAIWATLAEPPTSRSGSAVHFSLDED